MSIRRETCVRAQAQHDSPPHTHHNTNADEEERSSSPNLQNLHKDVSDIKTQMAAMQANLHFLTKQLRNPPHTYRNPP